MDLHDGTGTQARFHAYATDLASVLDHADRVRPFEDYCIGLLSAEGRKSVEPLAAVTAPERTAAQHQSLLHLVAQAPWSDQAVLSRVRERVLPSITGEEPVQAWIIVLPLIFPDASTFIVGGLPAFLIVGGGLLLERWGWVVKAAWCLVVGNASYSIYLTHTFVTEAAQKIAAKVQPEAFASSLVIAGTLIAVCVVGILVHRALEQPLSTLARRLLKVRRLNRRWIAT